MSHEPGGLAHFELGDLEFLVLDIELPEPSLPELTSAEREVARRAADGLSNAELAAERGVSPRTIANQMQSIFQKLGVSSRWDLSLLMTRRSLEVRIAAPTVITGRSDAGSRGRSGILNSPSTTHMLRSTYARYGVDFDGACARHGVALLEDGSSHREDYCALFEELAAEVGQPDLGLRMARETPMGSLGLLEWLALAAPTLGDALTAVSAHGHMLHPGGRRTTQVRGDDVHVAYWVDGLQTPRAVADWSLGCLFMRLKQVAPEVALREVHLEYADPGDGRAEDYFGCPIRFGSTTNGLVLPLGHAEITPATADVALFESLSAVARWRLSRQYPTPLTCVYDAIARVLARDAVASPRSVARELGVSINTLGRALRGGGASFDQAVSICRADGAVRALEERGAEPGEVGVALRDAARTAR